MRVTGRSTSCAQLDAVPVSRLGNAIGHVGDMPQVHIRYAVCGFLTSIFGPRVELFLSRCKVLVRDGLGTPSVPHFSLSPALNRFADMFDATGQRELASMLH
jgi:hypothetical protein